MMEFLKRAGWMAVLLLQAVFVTILAVALMIGLAVLALAFYVLVVIR